MDCKNCGTYIDEKDDVCKNCGEPVSLQGNAPNEEKKNDNYVEFEWNVHEFPKPKKTGDAVFVWNTEESDKIVEEKEEEKTSFEKNQFFRDLDEDGRRQEGEDIEKFFTFSKKKEEFQDLLDKEYERLKLRSKDNYIKEQAEPLNIQSISESLSKSTPNFSITGISRGEVQDQTQIQSQDLIQDQAQDQPQETTQAEPQEQSLSRTEIKTQIEEMEKAREAFFGGNTPDENKESLKEESTSHTGQVDFITEDLEHGDDSAVADIKKEVASPSIPVVERSAGDKGLSNRENGSPKDVIVEENFAGEKVLSNGESGPPDEVIGEEDSHGDPDKKEKKKSGCIWKGILIIVAIILAIEILILGILYLAPDSKAADNVRGGQTKTANFIVNAANSIKNIFAGEDDENQEEGQDPIQNGDQEGPLEEDDGQPENTETVDPTPDPRPRADKDALLASQMFRNTNIKQVKNNSLLAYNSNTDYGIADLNQSKPIENNIWYTDEDGKTVYKDESIVGALIAFNSKWIDYVNDGNKEVFELLKKDSAAHKNALNFSKLGKIKETFKSMEIGEIRQGQQGYYTWVHEEIEIVEGGRVENINYNWIYYLEPVNQQMKIVNYYKF